MQYALYELIRYVSIVLRRPLRARNPTTSAILARVLELLTAHIDPVPPFDFGLTALAKRVGTPRACVPSALRTTCGIG